MWDITIYHPSGPSVLAGTIFPLEFLLKALKRLRGLASSLALFPSSNRCGTTPKSTPPPFGTHRPYWHTASVYPSSGKSEKAGTSSGVCASVYPSSGKSEKAGTSSGVALITFVTAQILSSLGFPFRDSSQGFKMRLLVESFHTLINSGLFSSPTNVGHHKETPTNIGSVFESQLRNFCGESSIAEKNLCRKFQTICRFGSSLAASNDAVKEAP